MGRAPLAKAPDVVLHVFYNGEVVTAIARQNDLPSPDSDTQIPTWIRQGTHIEQERYRTYRLRWKTGVAGLGRATAREFSAPMMILVRVSEVK